MIKNPHLPLAIATALGTCAATAAAAEIGSEGLEEIVVTAQRRSESIQDVPITIQAFSSDTLKQLSITTFDDMIKYLPNVTSPTNGPAQGNIFVRGLSAGSVGTQSSGTIGGFPNVAVYLDDQSGQLPVRNLDIYAADLDRVEVLEGPQGTLFGGGAEAGVIRYITNKPRLNITEGNAQASYGTTAGGDPNAALTATLNLPLIEDKAAIRMVIYDDHRGGYINNVPATFQRADSDLGIHYANYPAVNGKCPDGGINNGYCVPPGSPVINNYALAGRAINPVTYTGGRLSGLYQFTDEWNVLITQTYQNMDAEGVFYQMPYSSNGEALPHDSVTLFNPSYDHDKFENTAWTLNGKFGDIKAVYTGGYLIRHIDQQQDYTSYARGVYADYYQCYGPGSGFAVNGGTGDPNLKSTCFSPSSYWQEIETNKHLTQEIRLSTPDDWRIRGIVGTYWEQYDIYDQTDWYYTTIPSCTSATQTACMTDLGPAPGSGPLNNPSTRPSGDSFFEDTHRAIRQWAGFASLDFDIIPKVLTLTGGARYFRYSESMTGTVVSGFYCFEQGLGPCTNDATNITGENRNKTFSGTKGRANLTWHVIPDIMLYYTWSQGFRPGAFNRTSTCHAKDAEGIKQFCIPAFYTSDSLTNNELGWKTEWFDKRVQFNGAVYQENWNNVQTNFFDPGALGNLTFGTNGQDFRIRGVELQLVARVTHELTLQGSAAWNQSEQTNSPYLIANNPALLANPATASQYGQPITTIPNPYGAIGSPSANSPPMQFNIRARYDWTMSDYNAFWQIGATHIDHSYSQTSNLPSQVGTGVNTTLLRFEIPEHSTYDASVGISKDRWDVELYGANITNVNASVFTSTAQFVLAETVVRPRVIGLKVGFKF